MAMKNGTYNGHVVELTEDQIFFLSSQPCAYCGIPGPHGIDRYNNSFGYLVSNSVSCCTVCNRAKGNQTNDEWENWVVRIIEFNS